MNDTKKRRAKSSAVILFIMINIIFLANGCTPELSDTGRNSPATVSPVSTQTDGSKPETVAEVKPEINFKLYAPHDRIMLIPAAVPDYDRGLANGDVLFYLLSDDMTGWEPAACTVTKIGSVTGRMHYEAQDSTIDVFQIKIGGWTGYYQRKSDLMQDNPARRILLDEYLVCEPRSKDYTVMQIFSDLYAIGADGTLKMASSRKTGGYDYNTAPKEGIGDLYGWSWISNPVCNIKDNLVFYLTAREKLFYSIWQLDLENGAEKRFGQDIAFRLDGIGNNQLIASMDGDHSKTYGKLISTSDPKSFTEMADHGWSSSSGWLCFKKNDGDLKFINDNIQLEIDPDRSFYPLFLNDDVIWLAELSPSINRIQYMKIDIGRSVFSIINAGYHNSLKGWEQFLGDFKSNELPLGQASDKSVRIELMQ